MMRVNVMGPLTLSDPADPAADPPVGGRRQRSVLVALALARPESLSVGELADLVWAGDPPRTADHTLQTYVMRLRQLGVHIERVGVGYRLASPTDVDRLDELVDSAGSMAPDQRAGALASAMELIRGPIADDVALAGGLASRQLALVERIESVRELAAAARLESAVSPAEVSLQIGELRALAEESAYREQRWELLITALYRAGRQSEALEAFARARNLLADDLGIEPGPGLRRLQQAVLSQDPSLDLAGSSAANIAVGGRPLPARATRLIGRERERRDYELARRTSRLTTMIGPQGAGKTRLALEIAAENPAQVWFVELDGLSEPASVAEAVMSVVSPTSHAADPVRGAAQGLRDSDGLLILDSAQSRLAEVGELVTLLLSAAPRLNLLITSRRSLGLRDESIVSIGPLTPVDRRELLIERVRLVEPNFAISADDLAAADRLTALVDGLPLGIELVARHLRMLPIAELADRVDADLERWTSGATSPGVGLVGAVAATVAELPQRLADLLVTLAQLPAEADLDLVGQVTSMPDENELFGRLAELVDRSLVQVRASPTGARYAVLLSVRRHCVGLVSDADRRRTEARYADAVLRRAIRLSALLDSPARSEVLRDLDADLPHIRAALAIEIDSGQVELGLTAASAMITFWLARRGGEGMTWLSRLLAASSAGGTVRANALLQMGHLAYWLTDLELGERLLAEARAIVESLASPEPVLLGRILRRMGAIAAARDDLDTAKDLLSESVEVLAGFDAEEAISLLHLGSLLADQGMATEALPLLGRARDSLAEADDPLAEGHALAAMCLAWWKAGNPAAAAGAGERALARFVEQGHRPSEGVVAYRLAAFMRALERPDESRRYAELALQAGTVAGTRTTNALAHIALARLDLDDHRADSAAAHLRVSLEALDVESDRWVLADALEVTARLQAERGASPLPLLDVATALRDLIGQPAPPTEAAEIRELAASADPAAPRSAIELTDAGDLRRVALDLCWAGMDPGRAAAAPTMPRQASN